LEVWRQGRHERLGNLASLSHEGHGLPAPGVGVEAQAKLTGSQGRESCHRIFVPRIDVEMTAAGAHGDVGGLSEGADGLFESCGHVM